MKKKLIYLTIAAMFLTVNFVACTDDLSVSLSDSYVILAPGEVLTLIPTINSDKPTKSVSWKSSNSNVTVNNGVVTAVNVGNAVITVTVSTDKGDKQASCAVEVKNIAFSGMTLDKSTIFLNVGESIKLTATGQVRSWRSSRPEIAEVVNGVVTAKSYGMTWIYISNGDGAARCAVKVVRENYMTMSMTQQYSSYIELGIAGSGKMEIDWGDGVFETYTLSENLTSISNYIEGYRYYRNVTIGGENITLLNCPVSRLISLDVSDNTALTELNCPLNYLTSLDVSKNTALTNLNCSYNQLTDLDVKSMTALKNLNCSAIQLTDLDVGSNTTLTTLSCDNNQLTSLDVRNNTALTSLSCRNNLLTNLYIGNTVLRSLKCQNNQLSDEALDALFGMLPTVNASARIYIFGNPGVNDCDPSIATNKGWEVNFNDFF